MARNTRSELQAFAERVEKQVVAANIKGSESMERLVCRLLTSKKTPQIAATMAQKWVEWKYGKATEHLIVDGHLEHTIFNAEQLNDEQLREAEALIESASAGSDPG